MEFFQTSDGLRLAYDIKGHGQPLLCLAGLTRNMDDFEPIVDAFQSTHQVIRLDSRGRGASDYAADFMSYSILQETHDVVALLDHLSLEKVCILGTSRGGLIALTLGAIALERLSGVIFNDIGPDIDPAGMAHILSYLGEPPPYQSLEEATSKLPEDMAPSFQEVPFADWRLYARRLWTASNTGLQLRYDTRIKDAVFAQLNQAPIDLWPFFERFSDLPVGIIRGENSNILSLETCEKMASMHPSLEFKEVPKRGHVPFLNEEHALEVIQATLKKVDRAERL